MPQLVDDYMKGKTLLDKYITVSDGSDDIAIIEYLAICEWLPGAAYTASGCTITSCFKAGCVLCTRAACLLLLFNAPPAARTRARAQLVQGSPFC